MIDFGIQGRAISSKLPTKKMQTPNDGAPNIAEELLAGEEDFDLTDPSDNYRLKFNRELTRK